MSDWRDQYLADIRESFALQRKLAERAIAQLDEGQLFRTAGPEDNSVAVIMKHVGGNLRSRWTEPFTTDGEKPDRMRDEEFVVERDDAASVRAVWERGWAAAEATLAALSSSDIERTLRIRGEPHSLFKALHRSLAHTAQHVGQIILLARQWKGAEWQTLSIPRGRSAEYLAQPPHP
jgi:hypothetical protein